MSILRPRITLIHEHIIKVRMTDRKSDVLYFSAFIYEFKELYKYRVRNIIGVTTDVVGRNLDYVNRIVYLTGINLVQFTEYYKEPFLSDYLFELDVQSLARK